MEVVGVVRNALRPEVQARVLRRIAGDLAIFKEVWEGTEAGELLGGLEADQLRALADRLDPWRDVDPEDPQRRIAIHEAGHAVAGILMGADFPAVTMVPDESVNHAIPVFEHESPDGGESVLQRRITVLMAGAVAQELAGWHPESGTEADEDAILEAVEHLTWDLDARSGLLAYLRTTLRDRLSVPATWRMVESVASALQDRGRLSRGEVVEVIGALE